MSPVCVTGMHRSGTSMVARILLACGLDLGEPDDLMQAAPDNPHGFYEHRRFVALNDELLDEAGGSWDAPPAVLEWTSGRFAHLQTTARDLVQGFANRDPWGWKDPRSALTLGFWLGIVPDIRPVGVLRNPLEVAWSLRRRNGIPLEHGLSLWWAYNSSFVDATRPDERLVSHYGRFLSDAESEIRRLAEFAGLHPSSHAIDRARRDVDVAARHNRSSPTDLTKAGVHRRVLDLYELLDDEAAREPQVAR